MQVLHDVAQNRGLSLEVLGVFQVGVWQEPEG